MQRTLLSTAPLLVGLLAGGSLEVQNQASWAGVERVKVRWDSGEVHVDAGDIGRVRALSMVQGPEAPLAYDVQRDGEILTISLQCRTPVPCSGELALSLPAGVQLELDLGDGLARLDGPIGDSTIIVGTGRIEATGLTSSEAILQVVEGDIEAQWAEAPRRVVLATVTGDAKLHLPRADYALEDRRGTAEMIGLDPVEGASRRVQVTTVEGSVQIHGDDSFATLPSTLGDGLAAR
jgi:hypothetical protein